MHDETNKSAKKKENKHQENKLQMTLKNVIVF